MTTILVVDDDSSNNTLVKTLLKDYRVVTARDAQEGIELAREVQPALILMDVKMPGMDGGAVTQIIKTDPELSHIPVVLLTATLGGEALERAREAGCDGYITKPFIPRDLKEQVQHYLRGNHRD